jgi:hypothetical protein
MTIDEQRPYTWTSADAAGLPIFPGLARYDEVAAGDAIYTSAPNVRPGPSPVISNFNASPPSITTGQSATLNWTASDAIYNIISLSVGKVRGTSVIVTPSATTTYTLYSTNQYGHTTDKVTVTVQ